MNTFDSSFSLSFPFPLKKRRRKHSARSDASRMKERRDRPSDPLCQRPPHSITDWKGGINSTAAMDHSFSTSFIWWPYDVLFRIGRDGHLVAKEFSGSLFFSSSSSFELRFMTRLSKIERFGRFWNQGGGWRVIQTTMTELGERRMGTGVETCDSYRPIPQFFSHSVTWFIWLRLYLSRVSAAAVRSAIRERDCRLPFPVPFHRCIQPAKEETTTTTRNELNASAAAEGGTETEIGYESREIKGVVGMKSHGPN